MSALEEELIEKIRAMDESRKLRVLKYVHSIEQENFDFDDWMAEIEQIGKELETAGDFPRVQDILDEVREERLNDLMGGR